MDTLLFPDHPQFWFETLRVLGHVSYGGADIGEVLSTVAGIPAGDYDRWYDAWNATARRIEAEARTALEKGHHVSAHDGLLRASTYFRTAEFFLHGTPDDPRIDAAYFASVQAFRDALQLSVLDVQPVEIPYETTVLHGYLYRPLSSVPGPTLIMHNGFDGSAEELHFQGALAGLERGYTVLTFDGPGQPAARHRDGLLFRPDWENVVSPVLDWLLEQPKIDADRVSLAGFSLGGLLAPRAAAFEPRLKSCVAVDGVYEYFGQAMQRFPQFDLTRLDQMDPQMIEGAVRQLVAKDPVTRWAVEHGQYVMGATSIVELIQKSAQYTLASGIAEQIRCPTLVCDAEEDLFFQGQPQQLYDHLTCQKTLMRFTTAEGAGAHCHPGAARLLYARVYDWLDEVMRNSVLAS